MANRLRPVDAVVVGLGWAGTILAMELAEAGLTVVGLERGGPRDTLPDFASGRSRDELAVAIRGGLEQDAARQTVTFRASEREVALPWRSPRLLRAAEGVGGAGVTWGGHAPRLLPSEFHVGGSAIRRYGRRSVPEDMLALDWPLVYEDLEPFYDRFEYVCGVSGRAGNILGHIAAGGNPFEGARSRDYPNPPLPQTLAGEMFAETARGLGLHPFPLPAANPSRPTTNSYGLDLRACTFCGFCEGYGCASGAKASPQTAVLPRLAAAANFDLRPRAQVLSVRLDRARRRVTGVTYADATGQVMEQPAELVVLAASAVGNAHLLLVSGIGAPWRPATGEGLVGRHLAGPPQATLHLFFKDRCFNPFMGAGALGVAVDDFGGDNFDHTGLSFLGGGQIAAVSPGAAPIGWHPVPAGTPRWGSAWKRAVRHWYGRTMEVRVSCAGLAWRGNGIDLDPTYADAWGRPLPRLTFARGGNDGPVLDHALAAALRIARAMRPDHVSVERADLPLGQWTGGAVMGDSPRSGVVNRWLQSWDAPNLFVAGGSALPHHPGSDPTATTAALAYWTAAAIRSRYLANPGPLESG